MLSYELPGLADIEVRKPQVSISNLEVGSNTNLAESQWKPAILGAHMARAVASWSVSFWTELDAIRREETLGVGCRLSYAVP